MAMFNLQGTCGFVIGFVQPRKRFVIVCIQQTNNFFLLIINYLYIWHFRCNCLYCLFNMYHTLVDFHMSTDTSVQNRFLVLWLLLLYFKL